MLAVGGTGSIEQPIPTGRGDWEEPRTEPRHMKAPRANPATLMNWTGGHASGLAVRGPIAVDQASWSTGIPIRLQPAQPTGRCPRRGIEFGLGFRLCALAVMLRCPTVAGTGMDGWSVKPAGSETYSTDHWGKQGDCQGRARIRQESVSAGASCVQLHTAIGAPGSRLKFTALTQRASNPGSCTGFLAGI